MADPRDVLAGVRLELARFPSVLEALLKDLDTATWRARPAPAEWAPVEIVCHLRDEEVEDFGARLRVIVEGGTAFAPIDPEGWAAARRYLDADGPATLAELGRRRAGSVAGLQTMSAGPLGRALAQPS